MCSLYRCSARNQEVSLSVILCFALGNLSSLGTSPGLMSALKLEGRRERKKGKPGLGYRGFAELLRLPSLHPVSEMAPLPILPLPLSGPK